MRRQKKKKMLIEGGRMMMMMMMMRVGRQWCTSRHAQSKLHSLYVSNHSLLIDVEFRQRERERESADPACAFCECSNTNPWDDLR